MPLFCYPYSLEQQNNRYIYIGNKIKNIIMAKKKQKVKLKEPVRIRFKQLANGNHSIYLDYYTGDVIRKENYVGGWKGFVLQSAV
ncbi:hypothetical protein DXC20_04635 [Bacteroides sp. OM08-17BH]|nr:hypothetical protein DXC20_04635 [Bacteroides sp. OM08-17BH]